jgi:hypothetical protein
VSTHSSDRFARVLGIAGLVLGLASFGWQVHTYRDGFAERVLVKLSMQSRMRPGQKAEDALEHGNLFADIVNTGQHPLYIKDVGLAIESETWYFHLTNGASTPLEPGAAATYTLDGWDISKHPLDLSDDPAQRENYSLIVASNKTEIFRGRVPTSILFYGGRGEVPQDWLQRTQPPDLRPR